MNCVGVNKLMPSVCTMNLRYKTFILLFLRVRVHMRGKLILLYGHHCISLELSTWSPDTTRDWLHADFYAWLDISSGVEKKSFSYFQTKQIIIDNGRMCVQFCDNRTDVENAGNHLSGGWSLIRLKMISLRRNTPRKKKGDQLRLQGW